MPQKKKKKSKKNKMPKKASETISSKTSNGTKNGNKAQVSKPDHSTLCLTMIVKNEKKIMKRCLDSFLHPVTGKSILDFVSICDTGSSDELDPRPIIKQWGIDHNVPTKIHNEPFKNFSYNRSLSMKLAKESFPQADYLFLCDADMMLVIPDEYKPVKLSAGSYMIKQFNNQIEYYNTRLLSTKFEFKCVGVTHEYWDGPGGKMKFPGPHELKYDDRQDGGCKSEKFVRDRKLLLRGLLNPNEREDIKMRYCFYLAQSYRDLGKYKESIKWYLNRIARGGFSEEVFYSYFQIGACYENLYNQAKSRAENAPGRKTTTDLARDVHIAKLYEETDGVDWLENIDELENFVYLTQDHYNPLINPKKAIGLLVDRYFSMAIYYYMKGWEYRPTRTESLYAACKLYRLRGDNHQAMLLALKGRGIKKPDDMLFVDYHVYKYLFLHEISINSFYTNYRDLGKRTCERLIKMKDEIPWRIYVTAISNYKHYDPSMNKKSNDEIYEKVTGKPKPKAPVAKNNKGVTGPVATEVPAASNGKGMTGSAE